jgi:hypothetical protein
MEGVLLEACTGLGRGQVPRKGKCSRNWATMLLKINEFKKKRKKLEISLDKKVESGIHSLS